MLRVCRRRRHGGNIDLAAFTLVELLVSISIIALLVAVLLPSLKRAREQAQLAMCLANLRSQGAVILQYTIDHKGRLPPQFVWRLGPDGGEVRLINRILAGYQGHPFEERDDGEFNFHRPTGIWRCPKVRVARDNAERWTHSGTLHHAPNLWLFSSVWIDEFSDTVQVRSDALTGWEDRYGTSDWRQVDRIRRPTEIVAIMDNVSYSYGGHGTEDRAGRTYYGYSWQVVYDPDEDAFGSDNRGSHDALARRPALLVDGHVEALPANVTYWKGSQGRYRPGGNEGMETILYLQEVRRFMWFIEPGEYAGRAD